MIVRTGFLLIAGTGLLLFARSAPLVMPSDIGSTNVKDAAYGAKGDGITDDTRAIRAALDKARTQAQQDAAPNCYYYPFPQTVYFPAGTYLVTDSISWISCAMTLQGQGMGATVIKLKSGSAKYANASAPKAVLKTRMWGNMSHKQNVYDLTILVGSGNPGAIGLDYISNNVGGIENIEIISEDLTGVAGLDMTRQWPGPCLIKNVKITGFNYGIRTGQGEYGPTFEHITLANQKIAGFHNNMNICAVRGLQSNNTVPAVSNTGAFILLDGKLGGGSSTVSAITNTSYLYARNVVAAGYRSAISNGTTVVAGNTVTEYSSDTVRYLFPGTPKRSLNLPVQETPTYRSSSLADWAKITTWGHTGDAGQWRNVFNAGKPIVYYPCGVYLASNLSIDVPAGVKLVTGNGCQINNGGTTALTLNIVQTSTDPLIIEKFNRGIRINHQCSRPVVIRHGDYSYFAKQGSGDVYTEDISADSLVFYPGQRVWMRQHNPEGPRLHILNNGARLWILGIKTEGTGTVVKTTGGGMTEVLGTLIYPCAPFTSLPNAAAFVCQDAAFSGIYRVPCYGANENYPFQIEETRKGVTKRYTTPNTSAGFQMPLFAGFDSLQMAVPVASAPVVSNKTAAPGRMLLGPAGSPRRSLPAGYALYDLRGRPVGREEVRPKKAPRSNPAATMVIAVRR